MQQRVVWYTITDVSEDITAAITTLVMEVVISSETPGNSYHTAQCYNPEDSHIEKVLSRPPCPSRLWGTSHFRGRKWPEPDADLLSRSGTGLVPAEGQLHHLTRLHGDKTHDEDILTQIKL
jgi:hypothetical protein